MLQPLDAVRSYHAALAAVETFRPTAAWKTIPGRRSAAARMAVRLRPPPPRSPPRGGIRAIENAPDFAKMTQAEKLAWNQARWKRILG